MPPRNRIGRRGAASDLTSSPNRLDEFARRSKTFWPTSIRTATCIRRAHILNISRSGAKVHAQQPLDTNQTLEIEIGDQWYDASVRWRREKTFGFSFHKTISDVRLREDLQKQAVLRTCRVNPASPINTLKR
ncbi:hypothetical protein EAH87_12280 [Sphingomonas koreensis]|nr:hypothetical protein EAH87_12280 [Sphingomonas koreensis]